MWCSLSNWLSCRFMDWYWVLTTLLYADFDFHRVCGDMCFGGFLCGHRYYIMLSYSTILCNLFLCTLFRFTMLHDLVTWSWYYIIIILSWVLIDRKVSIDRSIDRAIDRDRNVRRSEFDRFGDRNDRKKIGNFKILCRRRFLVVLTFQNAIIYFK